MSSTSLICSKTEHMSELSHGGGPYVTGSGPGVTNGGAGEIGTGLPGIHSQNDCHAAASTVCQHLFTAAMWAARSPIQTRLRMSVAVTGEGDGGAVPHQL